MAEAAVLSAAIRIRTWYIHEAPGVQASWVDMGKLARDRKAIPETEARRLYDNQWVPQGGNVVFPYEDVNRIFKADEGGLTTNKRRALTLQRFALQEDSG